MLYDLFMVNWQVVAFIVALLSLVGGSIALLVMRWRGCLLRHQWNLEDLGNDRTCYTCKRCGTSYIVVRRPGERWRVE